MSFVTIPICSSSESSRHSAAISVLFPEPTGPPTPIRNARSGLADKEALPSIGVAGGGELDRDRGGRRLLGDRSQVVGDLGGDRADSRREVGDPARGARVIEAEQR